MLGMRARGPVWKQRGKSQRIAQVGGVVVCAHRLGVRNSLLRSQGRDCRREKKRSGKHTKPMTLCKLPGKCVRLQAQ